VGDGSFQMVMKRAARSRSSTSSRAGRLHDGALGGSRWDIQEYRFGKRSPRHGVCVQPELAAIAEACGCTASASRIRTNIDDALDVRRIYGLRE